MCFIGNSSLRIPPILPAVQARIELILQNSIVKTLLPQLLVSLCASSKKFGIIFFLFVIINLYDF
jgi:hypothetical protein